jgi:protein required for attachment to host cells
MVRGRICKEAMMPGLTLKHDAWVVVMDGEKALFLRNEGDEKFVNLQVFREFEQDNPPTREQGTARPGRMNDSLGRKSAVEETDWHRVAEDRFAEEIADRLYRQVHKGNFGELVLAAPPKLLGTLRKRLHKEVRDRIVAEIGKDLTGHPVGEIEKIVLAG